MPSEFFIFIDRNIKCTKGLEVKKDANLQILSESRIFADFWLMV